MAKYYADKYGNVTANQINKRTLKYRADEYGNVINNLSLPQTTAKKKPKYTMDADGNIRLTVEPIKEEKEEKVVETTSKKEKDTWFKSGAFGDGKGNILTDTALTYWSTIGDAYLNAGKGIVGMVEGVADLGMYGAGAVADLVGADGVAESVRGAAKKNTTDAIYSPAEKLVDKYSVLGNKADNVSKGVGQAVGIIATAGAGAAAGLSSTASTILTTGVNFLSSAGSGMSEAYAGGANNKEAAIYGGIKGGIDAGTELLFGGLGKAANATGLSRGIGGLDDMAADALTKKITNQLVKNSAKYAFKSAGEGVEEVIAGALTAKAKQIYSEEEYSTLLENENLLEQFIVGSLVGGIVSTPSLVQSNVSGRDYTSGLTTNEQKVVDAEVKRRIEAQETDGKKLSKKEQKAIIEEVQYNLKKGYISTDVIESTLAGESEAYKNYQSVTKQEQVLEQKIKDIEKDETLTTTQKNELTNAFKKEIEALNKKQVVGKFVTEMDALTEKDNYLRESYNELGRSKEKFTADLSKYNDKEKEVIQAAMDSEVAGNSNQIHEFVDKLAKIYSDKGIFFKLTNNEKLLEEGRAVDGATVNGYVTEDGVVVLNVDSMKSLNTIVGHEITHTFEKNGVQDPELQNFVIELSKIRGDYDTKWQQIQNSYSDERLQKMYGKDVDFEAIRRAELTADLVGDYLFTDRKFIEDLSVQKPNIFKKIYEEIKYLVKTFTGSKEARQLEQVKRQFDRLYKQTTNNTESIKYDIAIDANGNKFVDVKEDILDVDNGESVARIIQKVISEKFKNLIDVNGQKIQINKTTNDEFRRSNSANELMENPNQAYNDKLRTIANANEILAVARDWIGEKTKHNRKDDIVEFARGNVTYRVGENGYVADVVVGIRKNGAAVLYDLVNIYETKIVDAPVTMASDKSSQRRQSASTKNNVSQDTKKSSRKYSISEDNKGRKLTKEQQEYFKDSKAVDENGKLVTVYHGSPDYGFTVFNNSKSDDGMSFFFTNDSDMANSYVGDKDKLYEVYLNLKNPYVVDAKGHKWNQIRLDENDDVITGKVERFVDLSMRYDVEIDFGSVSESLGYLSDSVEYMLQDEMDNLDEGETSLYTEAEKEELRQLAVEIDSTYESWDEEAHLDEDGEPTNFAQYLRDHQLSTKYTTRKIAKIAKEQGNDGVIIKNVYDNGKFHRETGIQGFGDVYIAFDSNQIKRVDNTNPTTNADIRYSLSENTGTLDDDIDAMWDAFTTEDWDEILGTSWITELGYNVVEEETTVKATEEMQNEEDKPRYKGDTSTVGKKAKLTDERIERLFSAYGADNPKYAKAYVTSIHPRDFLSLTLSDSSFEKWDDAANRGVDEELFPLDIDKLKGETQTPYLIVDTSTGRVTGHEGRHRMRALLEAGVTEVPIAIEDIRTKYSKEKEASMFISSQEYSKGYVNNNFGTEIKNLIPLNKIYREEILASYGGEGDINFSLSNQNQDIAPVGSYNVYGRDIALKTTEPAVVEDISPVREVAELPTPLTEEMANERDAEQQNIYTLNDAPEEIEAPYYAKDEDIELEDPFDERDIKDVGKRNVKAYMYENPEVKPYFQQEAQAMLWELQNSIKGEKNFNSQLYYDTNGELGWFGTTRETSDDIAYLLDNFKYTYADIEKGLNAIIEDHGAENNAISKRIEFALNDRLKDGYTDFMSGEDVPANQDYVNLLMDKQINTYSDEAYYEWLQSLATEEAPPLAPLEPSTDDRDIIAPVREDFDTPEGTQRVMDFENEQIVDEQETPKRKTHGEVQKGYVDNIKKKFEERGLDFDKVLEKAKNKSTFASVDNTPQRYIEKTFGYKEGQLLNDLTINQEALNESKAIKWLNSFTNRKDGELARLSKKYGIKPNSKEDAAAQMYAEGFYVNDNNEYMAYGDNELAMDFPDVRTQERIKGLANEPRIREIYDNTLAKINESRIRNGFPEIPKRDNYFLHFRAMDDTFSKLGIPFNPNDIRAKDLPTDINGMTADLRPNQPYFASANQRKGLKTSHSLLGGMERYLTSAKNQIYHIDDIQTLRGLRNYVADMYGQAHGLESLNEMTPEEAEARVKEVYDAHLSTFAKFLNEQANVLAGKTSLIDRGLEGIIGRRGITTLNTINTQVAKNMVGFNVSSALTNFVSAVQGFAKANKFDAVKAFAQTASNKFGSIFGKSDGFTENDPAIIRRKGAEKFYRTPIEKLSDKGYILMSAVDDITTEFLIRAKYNELTRKGMGDEQAHLEAGKWAMRILGDRSLGQQPQLYNSKMLGLVTKFQLEVRNQLDSMFYDTIQEANVSTETIQNGAERNAKKAAKIASTMVQLAVFQHLFGKAFESVAGYNPTFDIVSTLTKLFGFDDEEDDEDTVLDNVEQAVLELAGDMPYSSLFTGGRFPIESALPIAELVKGVDEYGNEKSRLDTLGEAAPYWLNPIGGTNQIKKSIKGLNMFDESLPVAGSYTDSGNLRFPIEDTTSNRIQAAIFGQWANENAKDYINNERQPLKEKQIQEFADLDIPIQEYWEYREGLKEQDTIEEKFDYIAGLDLPVSKKNILINNVVDREEKVNLINYDDFSGYEEFDFATKNPEKYEFFKNNNISYADYSESEKSKEAYSWAYKNPEKYTVSKAVGDVVQYKQYASELSKIKADVDGEGKSISGSRKAKVANYINSLNADYGAKIILYKSEYPSDDTYNNDIVEYLNSRNDITYAETVTILTELGFIVEADGTVRWN